MCACLVLINTKGDRSFFYHGGANELFSPHDVDETMVAEAAIVHVGGTYLLPRLDGEGAAGLFERAQAAGKLTSMDVTWDVTGRWLSVIEPCLPHLSYFMPSIREAERIAGRSEPDAIAAFFEDRGVGTTVIKLGEKGCYVKQRGKPGFSIKGFRTQVGATGGIPTFEEALRFMERGGD